ncbi:histidine kinase [Arthrobacter alpinus]|nr:histidine kinase [Arthrobacter alpinus]
MVLILMVWVLILFSWTAGDLTRTKRLREQALSDRAHRLEIEAQHERDLAASDERAHIAREMHDIVAHSLSVIITQADGARYAAAANPEIAPETLATIAATGRSSLQEMRRLLGVLRGGDQASTRPLPGLADLDELLLGIRATGLPVEFTVAGTARRQLPPAPNSPRTAWSKRA